MGPGRLDGVISMTGVGMGLDEAWYSQGYSQAKVSRDRRMVKTRYPEMEWGGWVWDEERLEMCDVGGGA